ncbi:ATP-binding protein [Streptomyces sp. CBMA152]|uniref:ATP-binding protein n=1 Tax=Streptomyces sp. CBMA152 TaxID=1896312 RepID=UPI001660B206|nr:ATP-binding protein [Streptomyces sp. CBMA152]MBD0745423.1 ATP-binding protein [Streptomyces sp. CBMA152]
MKQSAVKTLGAAAVGVAFAAAAAGTASAAPAVAGVPDLPALSGLTKSLPLENVTNKLTPGAPQSLAAGQNALAKGASTLPTSGADPVSGLLGGLPAGGGLPTGALGGLPLGG